MAVYPTNVRSFSTKIDLQDTVFALHINDLQDEMSAVQGELGALPKGTSASVRARLDTLDTSKAATGHDHANRLDNVAHDVTARHGFGSALGTPGTPVAFTVTTSTQAPAVGTGPAPAHEDHSHGVPSQAAFINMLVPAGVIWATGTAAAPPGNWVLCDGQPYSRTVVYNTLFAAIGIAYGAGDTTTTFNVPDFRRAFPMGKAASGTGSVLGGAGGTKDAVIVTHTHSGTTVSGGTADHRHYVEHTHVVNDAGVSAHSVAGGDTGTRVMVTYGGSGADYTVVSTDPNRRLYIVPTNIENHANHNHGNTGNMIERDFTDNSDTNPTHGHGMTNAGADSAVAGTDQNLPPYQTVNYWIKY